MESDTDISQENHIEALFEYAWPQLEDEVFQHNCLTSFLQEHDDAVTFEPCSGGHFPERCLSGAEQLPQRCPGSKSGVRDLARDSPLPSVHTQDSPFSPSDVAPCLSSRSITQTGHLYLNRDHALKPRSVGVQYSYDSSSRGSLTSSRQQLSTKSMLSKKMGTLNDADIAVANSPRRSASPVKSNEPGIRQETLSAAPKSILKKPTILTVYYGEGEQPMGDLPRLEGGLGEPVIVEAVSIGSKAALSGVLPGFALVSMNGRNEFMQLPGWQVRLLLEAPITLGFDTSFQSLRAQMGQCTEIRLKRNKDIIGVPKQLSVCGPKECSTLLDEVVFQPGASLFLKAGSSSFSESSTNPSLNHPPDMKSDAAETCRERLENRENIFYEVRRRDAMEIVDRAALGARAKVGTLLEADCIEDPPLEEHRSPLLPASCCTLEYVADCVASNSSSKGSGQRTARPKQYAFRLSQPAERGYDVDERSSQANLQAVHGVITKPKIDQAKITNIDLQQARGNILRHANGDQVSVSSSTLGDSSCSCAAEDDDSWLNFHSSKSPLRWLAPVLDPVVRAFSPSRSPSRRTEAPVASPRTPGEVPHTPSETGPSPRRLGGTNVFGGLPAKTSSESARGGNRGFFDIDTGVPSQSPFLRQVQAQDSGIRTPGHFSTGPIDVSSVVTRFENFGQRVGSPQNRMPLGDQSEVDTFEPPGFQRHASSLPAMNPSPAPGSAFTSSSSLPTNLGDAAEKKVQARSQSRTMESKHDPATDNSQAPRDTPRSIALSRAPPSKSPEMRARSPSHGPFMMTPLQKPKQSRDRLDEGGN